MFTGLVEATGVIAAIDAAPEGRRVRVATDLAASLHDGDSIAVNGVCLTVIAAEAGTFVALISGETLRVTTFGHLQAGRHVNLERPLRADGRFGGHFVLGHVDGVGTIAALTPQGESYWLEVDVPDDIARATVMKGSIAIDGISLTVASLASGRVGAQIVPFTFEHTTLGTARPGDAVNLEADMIGKYVARLLDARQLAPDASSGREVR